MGFPEKTVIIERLLTAAVLAAVLVGVLVDVRSSAAARVRERKPWAALVAFEASPEPPKLYLTLFHPSTRTAELIYVPDSIKALDGRPLSAFRQDADNNDADAAGAAKDEADAARDLLRPLVSNVDGLDRFVYVPVGPSQEPDAALDAARWAARLPLRLLLKSGGLRTTMGRADRLVWALEQARLGRDGLRPAWLPQDDAERQAFLGRLSSEARPAPPERLTVEVLNAAGKHGIAQEATKILRSRGADVMASTNAPQRQARTVIYDRAGSFEGALSVRRMLGCRDAQAVSQPDAKRLVDVTVVLADDCF